MWCTIPSINCNCNHPFTFSQHSSTSCETRSSCLLHQFLWEQSLLSLWNHLIHYSKLHPPFQPSYPSLPQIHFSLKHHSNLTPFHFHTLTNLSLAKAKLNNLTQVNKLIYKHLIDLFILFYLCCRSIELGWFYVDPFGFFGWSWS